jgi:hypothetical protein
VGFLLKGERLGRSFFATRSFPFSKGRSVFAGIASWLSHQFDKYNMSHFFIRYFIIILLVCTGCTSESHSDFSKALAAAVKDRKISEKKMQNILKEHEMLRDQDHDKAKEYVLQLMNAIKMGGDSTHIDVVRRQILGVQKGV